MSDADDALAPVLGADFRNWVATFREHADGYLPWVDEVTKPHVKPQGCKA